MTQTNLLDKPDNEELDKNKLKKLIEDYLISGGVVLIDTKNSLVCEHGHSFEYLCLQGKYIAVRTANKKKRYRDVYKHSFIAVSVSHVFDMIDQIILDEEHIFKVAHLRKYGVVSEATRMTNYTHVTTDIGKCLANASTKELEYKGFVFYIYGEIRETTVKINNEFEDKFFFKGSDNLDKQESHKTEGGNHMLEEAKFFTKETGADHEDLHKDNSNTEEVVNHLENPVVFNPEDAVVEIDGTNFFNVEDKVLVAVEEPKNITYEVLYSEDEMVLDLKIVNEDLILYTNHKHLKINIRDTCHKEIIQEILLSVHRYMMVEGNPISLEAYQEQTEKILQVLVA